MIRSPQPRVPTTSLEKKASTKQVKYEERRIGLLRAISRSMLKAGVRQ